MHLLKVIDSDKSLRNLELHEYKYIQNIDIFSDFKNYI